MNEGVHTTHSSMLDEFCQSLTDAAQVELAIRCARISLPIWEGYHLAEPGKLGAINAFILPENRVRGGAHGLAADMLSRALKELEAVRSEGSDPKKNRAINFYLATFLEVLTLKNWDELLPGSVRLAFTSVFNILAFLLLRRKNEAGETLIYLSINQSLDAVMREKILSQAEIETILLEYRGRTRDKTPESEILSPAEGNEGDLSNSGMIRAFQKIIDPSDGMPCCPKCKSDKIGEAGGIYEFTLMKCRACGYETYCDEYQIGDWYV